MTTGNLFFLPRAQPQSAGSAMPGATLTFSLTGTSTPSNVYTTSDVSAATGIPHSNPVTADANGDFAAIYLDPTISLRVILKDSGGSTIWTQDNVNANTFAAVETGSFTGTLTGMTGSTTGTINWRKTGNEVRLYISTALQGTSNTTAMTMTGIPAALQPTGARGVICPLADNNTNVTGYAVFLTAATGTITFLMGAALSQTGFTAANAKGLALGWSMAYSL